jgi:YbgC/YbaW family acyl-CoA thioester hydrolase
MARIQIPLPDTFLFTTELTVRVSDLNYGGHVGNDSILTLMQEARVILYRTLGFKDEISFEGSIGQIIADAAIQYKSEAFLGDILIIKIAIADFSKYGFDILYLLENKTSGKEVARGKTGIVCFDYDKRKVASIPAILLNRLTSL